jgi:hypothetical protein
LQHKVSYFLPFTLFWRNGCHHRSALAQYLLLPQGYILAIWNRESSLNAQDFLIIWFLLFGHVQCKR